MVKDEKERERRRERMRLLANQNQWIKKKGIEQTLEDMSAQLREYRRDLQQIRLQEAATEAKIDRLQQQVDSLEASLKQKKEKTTVPSQPGVQIADYYKNLDSERDGYSFSYKENGREKEDSKSTVVLYA